MKILEIVDSCLYIIDYNRRQMSEEELLMNIDGYFVKENELQQIKQDLEVLEILRKKEVNINEEIVGNNYDEYYEEFADLYDSYMILTEEDFNKIKQWLEENE